MSEVIASGTPHVARDILHDARYSRRQGRAAQHGFQSSIALPLKSAGAILGAIAIYAREADAFDDEEIGLLTELAPDIAYGVDALRTRVAREQAERAAREHERRLKESFEQAAWVSLASGWTASWSRSIRNSATCWATARKS
jgi:GAF domain-containing protein